MFRVYSLMFIAHDYKVKKNKIISYIELNVSVDILIFYSFIMYCIGILEQ